MRGWVIGVLVCFAAIAHARPSALPIEQAIERSAASAEPLVLVFQATWCKPCHVLAAKLQTPKLQQASSGTQLVSYDIDSVEGAAAAQRFNVSGVPVIVFVNVDGTQRTRLDGVPSDDVLVRELSDAKASFESLATLEAHVKRKPDDVHARMRLARYHRAAGHVDDAIVQLGALANATTTPPELASEALAAIHDVQGARARVVVTMDAAVEFATRFPAAARTSRHLVELAVARYRSQQQLGALLAAHLDAVADGDRREAIHAALAIGRGDLADAAVRRWQLRERSTPALRLLGAEVDRATGSPGRAKNIIDDVCEPMPLDHALWCYELRTASAFEHATARRRVHSEPSPGAKRMYEQAMQLLRELRSPGAREPTWGIEQLWALERPIGNAIARAFLAAEQRCGRLVKESHEHVVVQLLVAQSTMRATARSRNEELATCFERQLASVKLAASTATDVALSTMLVVEQQGAPRETSQNVDVPTVARSPSTTSFGRGAIVGCLVRDGGAIDTTVGVEARGRAAFTRLGELHVLGVWDLESSIDSGGHLVHIVRGYAGFGLMPSRKTTISVAAGFGSTSFGPLVDHSFEIPLEAALRVELAPHVRGHISARVSTLLGRSPRQAGSPGPDELGVGLGLVIHSAAGLIALGIMLDKRVDGVGATVSVGIPIGDYF